MTPSELKTAVTMTGEDPHFFDRSTMRFFGDTMRNYGVCRTTVTTYTGRTVDCWELYRRRPVKHGLQSSAYFDAVTFQRVFPDNSKED